MSQVVLEQTVVGSYGRKINLTVYNDGSVVVTGTLRVPSVIEVGKDLEIGKLAPGSAMPVIVSCRSDSIEAEMVRSGGPWMGHHEIPKMSAHFFPLSSKDIKIQCSMLPQSIPIASSKKEAA